jgi:hypothetical protein
MFFQILNNGRGFPEYKSFIYKDRYLSPRIDSQVLECFHVASPEGKHFHIIGELLMFKHKPDVPGEGGTGSIVKSNCHVLKSENFPK